jgi:hypothetical protein
MLGLLANTDSILIFSRELLREYWTVVACVSRGLLPSIIRIDRQIYIHAYIHTYIHTCMHACIHTYICEIRYSESCLWHLYFASRSKNKLKINFVNDMCMHACQSNHSRTQANHNDRIARHLCPRAIRVLVGFYLEI